MTAPAAGLLLAAGAGRRFGMPKALAPYRGALLVDHAVATLAEGGCGPVVVVTGAAADEVAAHLAGSAVSVVENPDWASGMASSLRAGLAALDGFAVDAVVVHTVDTPGVTAAAVRRVAALATPDALARATYDGVPGHPVLLGRDHWAAVAAQATGDTGARPYLAAHSVTSVPCADIADGADADRPEDLP